MHKDRLKNIVPTLPHRLNPAGIGEHSDIVETIEKEMMEIAKYDDILEMLDKYFKDDNKNLLG